MGKNSAEYMRAYRARRKAERQQVNGWAERANARIRELEQEVVHLKAELANRPLGGVLSPAQAERLGRKAQQAERDRILGRVNRGG